MIPVLYKANATDFTTYGIGVLKDCTSCEVTEERNGAFECCDEIPHWHLQSHDEDRSGGRI